MTGRYAVRSGCATVPITTGLYGLTQWEITIPELSTRIGVTERSIERNIKALQEKGHLRRIGPAKGGYWEVRDDD